MIRIIPEKTSISIENHIDYPPTMNGSINPIRRSSRTMIGFEAIVDECTFKKHPMHENQIEVQIEETIHTVVLDQYDIKYGVEYGRCS